MRRLVLVLALAGCRNVLGIPDQTTVRTFEVNGTIEGVIGASASVQLNFDEFSAVPAVDGPFAITGVANGTSGRVTPASNGCRVSNGDVTIDGASADGVTVQCDGLVALATFASSAPLDAPFAPGTAATAITGSLITQETQFLYGVAYPDGTAMAKSSGSFNNAAFDSGARAVFAAGTSELVVTVTSTPLMGIFNPRTYTFTIATNGPPAVYGYGKAAAPLADARFGSALAASGPYVVVGSAGRDEVVVYQRTGRTFVQQAVLTGDPGEQFGASVAIDGTRIVVGAPGGALRAGKAYVFDGSGGQWQPGMMLASDAPAGSDEFGAAVALSPTAIVVGAPGEACHVGGCAFVFDAQGNRTQKKIDGAAGDRVGASVALGASKFLVGAPDASLPGLPRAGVVHAYDLMTTEHQVLSATVAGADDRFGTAVAIDGLTALIGAPLEDSGTTDPNDNSKSAAGAAYLFRYAATWSQASYVKAPVIDSGDNFGRTIAIASGGVTPVAVIGAPFEDSATAATMANEDAPDSGAAIAYRIGAGGLTDAAYIKASHIGAGDHFGESLALTSESLFVGAPYEDGAANDWNNIENEDALDAGAVFAIR